MFEGVYRPSVRAPESPKNFAKKQYVAGASVTSAGRAASAAGRAASAAGRAASSVVFAGGGGEGFKKVTCAAHWLGER